VLCSSRSSSRSRSRSRSSSSSSRSSRSSSRSSSSSGGSSSSSCCCSCLSIYLIYPSIYLSIYLSTYPSINFWTWQHPKRSNSVRLPPCWNLTPSKTKQFCETSSVFELDNIKNEAILGDLTSNTESWVQSWRPRTHAFCDFPLHLSKYCACHEKVMPGHTKCCTCHAKSS